MITFPELTSVQVEELSTMKKTQGFSHLAEMMKVNIEMLESSIMDHDFTRDDNGEIKKISIIQYEDKQKELALLKSFFYFLDNCDSVQENKIGELSEEYEVHD